METSNMKGIRMKRHLAVLALAAAASGLPAAHAAYPDQPIRIVVGYAAGGTTDILARVLGEQPGKEIKQSIIVENKPGAAGHIDASTVQDSRPDGYTFSLPPVTSDRTSAV